MEIRTLRNEELEAAMRLKVQCWDEELAGVKSDKLIVEKELIFVKNWLQTEKQYNDIRIMIGAFEGNALLGFTGASIAESSDMDQAIELNYLFVNREFRGQGISLNLVKELIQFYDNYLYLIVYNHHYAPSNDYYRYLGGEVIRTERQGTNNELLIDIFSFDLKALELELNQLIKKKHISKQ